ncbi:MAG: exosortase C-terminal domain/associated protein EpsI [Candidatus Omnitrophota bacterium]
MKTNKNQTVVAVLLVALIISLPLYLVSRGPGEEARVATLPMEINGWTGRDLPVEERAYEILETRNLILREYKKGERKVYLYVVYSSDNRKVSHPPEVCFEGSGVTIINKNKIEIPLAGGKTRANQLIVERAGVINVVVYWYKAGEMYTDNYLKQQFAIAVNHLKFKRTSGALIRMSAESFTGSASDALENIREFAQIASEFFPSVIP